MSETTVEPVSTESGISESDLENIIDRVVAKRTEGLEAKIGSLSMPDTAALKGQIVTDVLSGLGKLFEDNKSPGLDENAFTKKIGDILDNKLRDFSQGKTPRKAGPLARWMGLGT